MRGGGGGGGRIRLLRNFNEVPPLALARNGNLLPSSHPPALSALLCLSVVTTCAAYGPLAFAPWWAVKNLAFRFLTQSVTFHFLPLALFRDNDSVQPDSNRDAEVLFCL